MVCITGAAGFIGSTLLNKISSSQKVLACDPNDETMIHPDDLFDVLAEIKPSVIYHLGAISSTTETDTRLISKNNIEFSCKILEFCIENNVKLVYASSASVYGHGKKGFSENCTKEPLNYYAISKSCFDDIVQQKILDNPLLRIYGLRYYNVYGANEEHKKEMSSPIYKFLKQAKIDGEIKIFEGSEKYFRDFIHVDDVVSITISASEFDNSGIYNVGTGKARSFKEVAEIISKETNSVIKTIQFPEHLKQKYQSYTCSDNSKIDCVYKQSRINLKDGIKMVINEKSFY